VLLTTILLLNLIVCIACGKISNCAILDCNDTLYFFTITLIHDNDTFITVLKAVVSISFALALAIRLAPDE
jgi:intracellular septation protein A